MLAVLPSTPRNADEPRKRQRKRRKKAAETDAENKLDTLEHVWMYYPSIHLLCYTDS
jgi:hypothetical protein